MKNKVSIQYRGERIKWNNMFSLNLLDHCTAGISFTHKESEWKRDRIVILLYLSVVIIRERRLGEQKVFTI